jgi:glycyl-tRNA synthetase beta chain
LEENYVIVDFHERRQMLRELLDGLVEEDERVIYSQSLLDEVTNLLEYPHAVVCTFPEEYLELPAAVLEAAMTEHQRYFPVRHRSGRLVNKFVAATNRKSDDSGEIREGNERVLNARLADAKFFWDEDRKKKLEERLQELKDVVFLEGIGSLYDKARRLERLCEYIAVSLGRGSAETDRIKRAALLCKADLITEMVGEFPRLQGVMGYEYAIAEGENEQVAVAIREHYLPRFVGDELPESLPGAVLSIAEKVDNLVACFATDNQPSGSHDPLALRRQAIAMVRICRERSFDISLESLFARAQSLLPKPYSGKGTVVPELMQFLRERIYQMCVDEGYPYDLIRGVLSAAFANVVEFFARLQALNELRSQPQWPSLVAVVERTFNIHKNQKVEGEVQPGLFQQEEERELWEIYQKHAAKIRSLIEQRKYYQAAAAYHKTFAEPVHRFFDKVFVHVEDKVLRNNRLLLVKTIGDLFSRNIADLSEITTDTGRLSNAGAGEKA